VTVMIDSPQCVGTIDAKRDRQPPGELANRIHKSIAAPNRCIRKPMAEADPSLPDTKTEAPTGQRRRWGLLTTKLSVPLALLIGGLLYWQSLQGKVSTDNAYVQQDMVAVSAEVGGRIVEVMVAENDQVQAGDLLFRIDPEPYQLQLREAEAAIASAQA